MFRPVKIAIIEFNRIQIGNAVVHNILFAHVLTISPIISAFGAMPAKALENSLGNGPGGGLNLNGAGGFQELLPMAAYCLGVYSSSVGGYSPVVGYSSREFSSVGG